MQTHFWNFDFWGAGGLNSTWWLSCISFFMSDYHVFSYLFEFISEGMSFVSLEKEWSKLWRHLRYMTWRQRSLRIITRMPQMVKEVTMITWRLMCLDGLVVRSLFPRKSCDRLGSHFPLNIWRYFSIDLSIWTSLLYFLEICWNVWFQIIICRFINPFFDYLSHFCINMNICGFTFLLGATSSELVYNIFASF